MDESRGDYTPVTALGASAAKDRGAPLSLLTWNCFGAAMGVVSLLRWKGAADHLRLAHPDVLSTLGASDVVCMQEVFLEEAEALFDSLAHPHKVRELNHNTLRPLTVGGSGLAIASRLPFQQHVIRAFAKPQVGSERLARKGSLHATVTMTDGNALHIATTHMQSGYSEQAGRVRIQQLRELRAVVDSVPHEETFLLCGDFNVCGLSPRRGLREYAALHELFADFVDVGAEADEPTFDPRPRAPGRRSNHLARRFEPTAAHQRVDYVLFRAGRSALRVKEVSLVFTEPLVIGGRTTHPSDHYAVRVQLG